MDSAALHAPRLTIVVPVYNSVVYLSDLLHSFDGQACRDFDVVFVDDGSTDGSYECIAAWRVGTGVPCEILRKPNEGISSARNMALEHVGQRETPPRWVMFVDSDDMLMPTAVEELLHAAEAWDVDSLFYTAEVLYESDELKRRMPQYLSLYDRPFLREGEVCEGPTMLLNLLENGKFVASPCLQMQRWSFLQKAGIRFHEGIIHEDNLFTARCLFAAHRVAFLNRGLYVRRVRAGSTMTKPLSWANVDGYFTCAFELLREVPQSGKEAVRSAEILVDNWLNGAVDAYALVTPKERERYVEYPTGKRLAFSATVLDRYRSRKQSEDSLAKCLQLEGKLQRVCGSKSYRLGLAMTFLPRWIRRKLDAR